MSNTINEYKHALDLHYADKFEESQLVFKSILDNIDKSSLHRIYFNMGLNAKYLNNFDESEQYFLKSLQLDESYLKPYTALHELYSYNYDWRKGSRLYDYNYAFDIFHYNYETSKAKRLDWDDPHVQRAISIKFNRDISSIKNVSIEELNRIYINSLFKVKNNVIHVIATQGLGDVIQTSNLVVKLLEYNPKKILLSVSKEVVRLVGDLHDKIEVCCQKLDPDEYDYFIPSMSLIKLIGYGGSPCQPWIHIRELDLYFAEQMINNFQPKGKLIGINWRGNPLHINDSKRSLTLEKMLIEIGDMPNNQLFSFQYKPTDEERELMVKHNIIDLSSFFTDMYDMAMYLKNMNIFVTIDSAPLHLAGALGVRTFGLLPDKFEDWRWGNKKDKILYNSLSLIRFKI